MGSWPTKARPTWAGVVLIERTGERVVPWLDALHHSAVTIDGQVRRIEFKRSRDGTLADAHRRRAIRNALRAGESIRWRNPHQSSPSVQRLELAFFLAACFVMGSLGVWLGVLALGNDTFRLSDDVPTALSAFIWTGLALLIVAPLALCVFGIRGVLAIHRDRVSSVQVDRDRLTVVRRDRTETVVASEVRSLTQASVGRAILTASGIRLPLGNLPKAIIDAWFERSSPGLIVHHDRSESRMMRRAAITMLVGMLACVLLAWWLDRACGLLDHSERPNVLHALFIVPILPGVMWWAYARKGTRNAARR